MNVGFISLGCSKNLVDTEKTICNFKENGFSIVNNPEKADIIIINTCGFIKEAKEEAINTILEMSKYKEKRCKYLIAMGCLVQRYKKELEKELPEVDLFLSIDEYDNMLEKVQKLIKKDIDKQNSFDYIDRVITTGKKMAYLKIAEGCSNRCTYCAIPYIRGPYISRKMEDIIEEAKKLGEKGYEELIVIAQDTTKYGIDLYGKESLAELLEKLSKIDKIKWIRFLYAYPESITDELIKVVKENPKICNYFDIPIQHISDRILKKMNRKSDSKSIKNIICKIRKEIPDVIIRTSLIVGFPGETEKDFEKLYDFVKEIKFDRLGTFMYSKEDGTPASRLKDQIHHMTKKSRYNKIMSLQQNITMENLDKKIGKEYEVLVENISLDGKYFVARSYMDVPDMDGVIYIKKHKENLIDKFVKCKIIKVVNNYDLEGELV